MGKVYYLTLFKYAPKERKEKLPKFLNKKPSIKSNFIDIIFSYTVQVDISSIIYRQKKNLNHMIEKSRSCQLETSSLIELFPLFDNLNVFDM